jgi:hypothetical protein
MPRPGVLDEPTRQALLRDVQQLLPPHERAFAVVYDEAKGMVFASATDGNVYYRRYPENDAWRILGADEDEACVPYHVRQAQRQREAASGGADTGGADTDKARSGDGSAGADNANAAAANTADAWEEAEARFAEFYISHAHERPWPICSERLLGKPPCSNHAVVLIYNCGRYHALCAMHAHEYLAVHPTAELRTECSWWR